MSTLVNVCHYRAKYVHFRAEGKMPVQNIRPNDVLHNVPFIHKKSGMLYGVYV